ncbi:MAG: hypothetical protein GWN30_31795 [Gammaproteobacteria bacterium]|nr:hypothetical protein [Gammaproteobacteria bacterium]
MYNNDTELLFPSRVIKELAGLRDQEWEELVSRVKDLEEDSVDHLAFVLMMSKLDGCMTCNSDSFRAMRGCTQCAILNIRRFRGKDGELLKLFEKARKEIKKAAEANSK